MATVTPHFAPVVTPVESVTITLTAAEAAVLLVLTGRCNSNWFDDVYNGLDDIIGLPVVKGEPRFFAGEGEWTGHVDLMGLSVEGA